MAEDEEIEVIDVSLNETEIDEVIAHLMELKEHKSNVQFPLASDLDLSVTFSDEEAGENDAEMQEVKTAPASQAAPVDSNIKTEVKNG